MRIRNPFGLKNTQSAPASEGYLDWRTRFIAERLLIFDWLCLIANPMFIVADFLFYRQHLASLLAIRSVMEVGFVLCLLVLRSPIGHQHNILTFLAVMWFGCFGIAQMTVTLGGFQSTYYQGLNLVFLAVAVIVPVYWPMHLAGQLSTGVYYYGVNLLFHQIALNLYAAIENAFFIFWTSVATLFAVILYERLQRAEFRARRELESSNQKLLELDRLKSQFFANISHELRTPLTLSLGAYKTLLGSSLSPECQEVASSGLRNTTRLIYLINELLDLAKFDSGRADLKKRPINLTALVRTVASNFESRPNRRVNFSGLDEPLAIEADPRQIKKVLYNLLSNAFKFSDPEKAQVWIRLRRGQEHIELEVQDNGIGIPRGHLERIFDRFTQVEGSTARRYEGTGIGLALVKEIVTLHGGSVTVDSEVRRGSTFLVTLPIGQVDVHHVPHMEEDDEEVIPASKEPAMPGNLEVLPASAAGDRKPLLLVADDNPDMRSYLERLLSKHYRVELAKDGIEALEKAKQLQPELVLTDVMMPQKSGDDLLREVRRDETLRLVPVIFLTARAGIDARVESFAAGADDYLSKPFNEEELLARIHNQLRIRAQEKELEAKTFELQQLNRQLEALNERLRELDQRKSEFVSMVSHELRTPMSAIQGYVDNMQQGLTGALTEKQRFYLGRIKFNIERLLRMINELLDLSRIEAGQIEIRSQPIVIAELVNNIIDGLQTVAREKSLNVHAVPPTDSLKVQGDQDKLTQIATNLIHNAMKFTPEGGDIRVEFQKRTDDFVQICVADTGCGIPSSEVGKVFDKFYRGSSVASDAQGAGLGLSIVKRLVELQGGSIWVESTPGEGSRFYFTVPLVRP